MPQVCGFESPLCPEASPSKPFIRIDDPNKDFVRKNYLTGARKSKGSQAVKCQPRRAHFLDKVSQQSTRASMETLQSRNNDSVAHTVGSHKPTASSSLIMAIEMAKAAPAF